MTNPMQECMVNGEEPTWQIPETELTDSNPEKHPSQPARKWKPKLNDTPLMDGKDKCFASQRKIK
ncbi:hypothetical protein E2C01_039024 [Portunus trituberculatus]|uniref:Uncharacterized protein n=1 Tax=Portunus trituberculatus TaxID=210409 RepID=A0A5B7FK25_PORTR|nr:hypothetical protein [Portunus trituberculatus]